MDAERNAFPRATLSADGARTRLVLLGTAGGSIYYPDQRRRGVASAVVVGEAVYLVDCGDGVVLRYRQAGLGPPAFGHGLDDLRAIFFTHLHSDHTVGYPGLLVAGFQNGLRYRTDPIQVYGPGRRGSVKVLFAGRPTGVLVDPANPMPGTADLTRGIFAAYATDVNERALRQGRPTNPEASFDVHDIPLPAGADDDPMGHPAPEMDPFAVYEDAPSSVSIRNGGRSDRVLGRHPPQRQPGAVGPRGGRPRTRGGLQDRDGAPAAGAGGPRPCGWRSPAK